MKRLSIVILALFASGAAPSASGQADELGLQVAVDNGQGHDCTAVVGLCVVTTDLDHERGTQVSADHDVRYVGLAWDPDAINTFVGFHLLPDGSVVLDPSDTWIDAPVMRLASERIGTRSAPEAGVLLVMGPTGFAVPFFDPEDAAWPRPRLLWYNYSDGILQYDGLHVRGDLGETSTDDRENETAGVLCFPTQDPGCKPKLREALESQDHLTPNLTIGVSVFAAELGLGELPSRSADGVPFREHVAEPLGPRDPVRTWDSESPAPPNRGPAGPLPSSEPSAAPRPGRAAPPEGEPRGPQAPPPPPRADPPLRLAAAIATGFALSLLLAALSARIRGNEAKLHEMRSRILAILKERGPCQLSPLAREIGIDRTSLEHHARILKRGAHIVVAKASHQVILALPGQEIKPGPSARGKAGERILEILRAHGGSLARRKLVALADGLSVRTRNQALVDLSARGLVVREIRGTVETIRLPGVG